MLLETQEFTASIISATNDYPVRKDVEWCFRGLIGMGQGEGRITCCRGAGFGIELWTPDFSNTARLRHVEWGWFI